MATKINKLVNFSFSVVGVNQLSRSLGVMADHISDLRPAWKEIRKNFYENERKQFRTQGGHASGGWKRLSPSYAAQKAKRYPGRTILVRTGTLEKALTHPAHTGSIWIPRKTSVSMGTSLPYAKYHQVGTRRMPSRPPVELTAEQKTQWPKIIHEYIWKSGQGMERVLL